MSKLKRFASVLLALVMCFGLTVTAFATDYSITVTNPDSGYTYTAYQVFTGDYDATAGTFTNIKWGSNIDPNGTTDLTALYTALAAITDDNGSYPFTSNNTASGTALTSAGDVAAALAAYGDDSTVAKAFAAVIANYITGSSTASTQSNSVNSDGNYEYTISSLAEGYYLVETTGLPADGTYTRYILQVANDEKVESKSKTPTFDKTIDDINDSTGTEEKATSSDSADYDAGDDVPYTLTATLPDDYASYTAYTMTFHDSMDTTYLTFKSNSVVVTVYDTNGDSVGVVDSSCYTVSESSVTYTPSGTTSSRTGTFEVKISDTKSLTSGGNAITTGAGYKIVVTYTAKLSDTYTAGTTAWNYAYLEFSNNPNWDGTGTSDTGNTPEEEVVVISLKLVVNKTDTSNNALNGATFTLYKWSAEDSSWETVKEIVGTSSSTFTWDGLDDGYYKLVETTEPTGYKAINPIYFTVAATHSEDLNSGTSYADVLDSLTVTVLSASDVNSLLNLTGSDALSDSDVNSTATLTGEVTTGTITTTIANSKTSSLPSTGGIGTTIFYVVGGVLVVGAVVLLITRKRMKDGQ